LFAGELKHIIPYAVPRDVRWIVTYENSKRPTVIFDQSDKTKMINYKPQLSRFPSSTFTRTPSGEFFSRNPGHPNRQETIRNPINFMRQWYNVKFVPNLVNLATKLKTQNVHFDSEGL
jgi:hypothetical protein